MLIVQFIRILLFMGHKTMVMLKTAIASVRVT